MDIVNLFISLKRKKKDELLKLLQTAFNHMNSNQKQTVFGEIMVETIKKQKLSTGNDILKEVKIFYNNSLAGNYYAPFDINSKNFMDVPEETDEWCDEIGMLLGKSCQLTKQGYHEDAIKCFQMLFDLFDRLDEEIIFADEVGTWMIGGDEKEAIKCYLSSLAEITAAKVFVEHVMPLVERDSYESFSNGVYKKAIAIANKEQGLALKKEVVKCQIRTK